MRPLSLCRALRHCYVVLALRLSNLVRQSPARTQVQGERQPEAPHPDEQTDAHLMMEIRRPPAPITPTCPFQSVGLTPIPFP